jgi:hypothetical protein
MTVLIPTVACLIALGSLGGGLAVGGLTAIALYRQAARIDELESRLAAIARTNADLQQVAPLPRRTIARGRERWADLIQPADKPLTAADAAWRAALQRDLREL